MKEIVMSFVVASTMLLFGCVIGGKDDAESLPLGVLMPEFSVSGPDGELSTSDLVGERTLVVLFRTTCPDCNREMPGIEEAFRQVGSESGLRFVAISKESEATVAEYWRETKLTIPWYLDSDGSVFSAFDVHFVPTLYLFGSDGKLAYTAVETFDFSVAELVRLIDELK